MPDPEHPWYEEAACTARLTQGDIIEVCPVLAFAEEPAVETSRGLEGLRQGLDASAGVEPVRAILMTRASDLVHAHVRNVILSPIYHVADYRTLWEEAERARGQNPTSKSWEKHTKEIRDGKIWNLAMLRPHDVTGGQALNMPDQIVDFHGVFGVPLRFLAEWVRASGAPRLRLRPPHREHLSQSFARFFTRVGLPQEINL